MKSQQTMKPATAAKKLGVYLEATPEEFQAGVVSRDELNELQSNPPQWLADLRRNGTQLIAQKLGISASGLVRSGITEALTTDQINAIKEENPDWLVRERQVYVDFKAEEARLQEKARLEEEA